MTVSTSGCAMVLHGNPSPAGTTKYGFELSDSGRYLADSAAFVRSLDPCGFLDEDRLASLGTLVQLKPEGQFTTCTADLASDRSGATSSVTIDVNGYQPPADYPNIEQVTIAGEQALLSSALRSTCRISFPLREEFDGATSSTIERYRVESERSFATIDVDRIDGDACAVAKDLTETVLGRLSDPPMRADSKYNLPLAMKDPCSVIQGLPQAWTVVRWEPTADPYGCDFTASSPASEEFYAMVDVELDYDDSDLRSTDRDTVRSGDYTVGTLDMSGSCSAETVVGNPVLGMPEEDGRSRTYSQTTPTVSAMTDDCDSAIALAVAAADVLTG